MRVYVPNTTIYIIRRYEFLYRTYGIKTKDRSEITKRAYDTYIFNYVHFIYDRIKYIFNRFMCIAGARVLYGIIRSFCTKDARLEREWGVKTYLRVYSGWYLYTLKTGKKK